MLDRLYNWRRWACERDGPKDPQTGAFFKTFLPDQHDKDGWGDDGEVPPSDPKLDPVDVRDAELLDGLIQRLPDPHKIALFWGLSIRGYWYGRARKAGAKYWDGGEQRQRMDSACRALQYLADIQQAVRSREAQILSPPCAKQRAVAR